MIPRAGFCLLVTLAFAITGPATHTHAQAPLSDEAKTMTSGTWEFSNADRDKRCTVVFRTEPAAAGMRLDFDKACAGVFPFITEIAGWTLTENDFLRMLDTKGKSVLEFSEVESRIYEAPRPGEGILFIQASNAVGPAPKDPNEVAGDWGFVHGSGKPVCTVTLATTPAGPDLALKLKPGCDAFVTRFAPSAWQMDRGELLLKNAKGQTWRFEEADGTTWERVPESADPILLVKQ